MAPFDDDEDEATMIAHRDEVDDYGDEDEATVIARRQDPLPTRPAPAAGRPRVPPPPADSEATALLVHDARGPDDERGAPEEDLQRTRIDAPRARPEAPARPMPAVVPHPLSGTAPLGPAERARARPSAHPPASVPPPRSEVPAATSGAHRAQSAIASGPFRAQPGLGSGVPSASLSGAFGAQPQGPLASAHASGAYVAQPQGPLASAHASGAYVAQAAPLALPFGPAAGLSGGPASAPSPKGDDALVLSTATPERQGAPAWVVTYVVACAVLSALGVAALVYLKLESYF